MKQLQRPPLRPSQPPHFGEPAIDTMPGLIISKKILCEDEKERVRVLLERSFGKPLASDYFESPMENVLLERGYRAIAIIKRLEGTPYLDKVAVSPAARGHGRDGEL